MMLQELLIYDRQLSSEPKPVPRPWHARALDWLLRRPVLFMSERDHVRAYLMRRHGIPGAPEGEWRFTR